MPGFEEEAFARAQRMSRSRAVRETQDIQKEPSGSEPEKEKTPLPIPEQSSKKEIKSIRRFFKRVLGGYECNQGKFLGFKRSIPINHRKPQGLIRTRNYFLDLSSEPYKCH